jgi:hypothetical protein
MRQTRFTIENLSPEPSALITGNRRFSRDLSEASSG